MNLRELEYLVAIEEEGHFHRAAERCFVSQPTLSGQLKKLEQELDIQLVERSTRQVVMTDAGREITSLARRVLNEVRNIHDVAQSYSDPMVGELQVGLIPTLAPYLLPHIIPLMKKHYPQLKLWLHEYQTSVLLQKLKRAELDLLILALPVDTDEFSELTLFEEAFQLAVAASHELASKQQVNLDDLVGREMLLLEEGHCLRGQALDVCFMAGATENAGFQASSLETLRHMVGEDMGITLIPELAVPNKIEQSDICYLIFEEPKPTRRIGMLYRRGSYRQEAFEKICELVKKCIG